MSTRLLRPLFLLLACIGLISGLRAAIPAISAGDSHSLFLKSNGSAWACGKNSDGQVGNGSFGNVLTPVQVMTDVQAISAGNAHSLFLMSNGSVWACGANNHGQLGNGTNTSSNTLVQITSLSGVKAIAAGYQFSLFLKTDGSVWACGNNGDGQFGNGGFSNQNVPVQVFTGVQAISAGGGENGRYTLFLKTDGSVWGAGDNGSGVLGDGSTGDRVIPVQATGLSSGVTAISAGESHSLFLKSDESVWACGANSQGPFGTGTTSGSNTPVQVQTGIQAIEAGYRFSLFVRIDGSSARACGYNQSYQLGDNSNMTRLAPVQPIGMTSGIQALSAAGSIQGSHSLFMKFDGSVWACGENGNGQLGDGSFDDRSVPVQVLQLIDTPVVIAPSFTAVTATSATLGGNVFSAGLSAVTARGVVLAPTATNANPALGGSGVTNLSTTGGNGVFTVNATSLVPGTAYSFRAYATNSQGTGYSSTVNFTAPSNVATLASLSLDVASLFPGFASGTLSYTATVPYFYSSVTVTPTRTQANASITINGSAATSGSGRSIPLSLGSNTITIVVTAQDGVTTRTYTIAVTRPGYPPTINTHPLSRKVNPGQAVTFTIAATASGEGPLTYQWRKNHANIPGATGTSYTIASTVSGDNGFYSCAVSNWGTTMVSQPAFLVVGPYNPVLETAAISAGYSEGGGTHCLFLKTDGSAWASGGNANSQLGDGTTSFRYNPVQALSGVKAIAAGYGRSFFLKTDDTLWACGQNGFGQFGDGTTTQRSTPGQVMTGVKAIASGKFHSLFLKTDGSVWSCGSNSYGQLGDGTTTTRSAPVQVMTGVKAIAAGYGHSLFLKTDGSVWACGRNNRGQLGNNDTALNNLDLSTPVQVMSEVQAIAASGPSYDVGHSLFLKYDGSVWACGDNGFGQLGEPASYSNRRDAPVQMMTGVQAIAAGSHHSLFLKTDGSAWGCGSTQSGQLGDPNSTITPRTSPVQVPGMTNVQAISAGELDSLFLKTDGYVWACGWNTSGQHGTGWNDIHWSPVQSLQLITYQPDPWQQANFGANATNEQISGWDADPDRDGLVNLLERAFNLPPLTPGVPILTANGTAGLPRIWVSQGPGGPVLNVQYLRLKAATNPGLTYTPQFSSALTGASWSAASGTESVVSIDPNWERVTITDTVTNTTRFARVKVLKLP
ncbi:cadherin-like beta sandwich domain-containing protein [Luteolibacter sp. GHJ8]|uniref:Cadherin-like beta sandwich domain-containing protein n=1 Tax=Luteolibacter rhizosphaerae TaxID=2989719 RepID=A0ABT3G2S5_9BACT|nr:cadherin-like beta sandwich domain-containing protein [Luteolibacter rhizosphaerae]MCW1914152.1 cadherin-like beta sandwich domain-containing protein [Luteolibacter rhizosphaerae]